MRKDNVVHELGHWDIPELAACAYDAMAVEFFQEGANLNFHECLRCQMDKKFFIDLLNDFLTRTCTLMKMLKAQQFNCLVTNEANCNYFGRPGWKARANAYKMEAGERATLYLDYDREEIMVYYKLVGSDDGSLTPDYDPDSARQKVIVS
ncbi:hypothetical protein VPH35_116955 [Triticum aestivum]|uniref:Uncharacterized protein n=1 Tax=Aegilops tauschii TaxID=37682 RepID=M8D958_AEGTA